MGSLVSVFAVEGDGELRGGSVAGKFEIYKDSSGGFRFRLKAGNGEVIATGESYKTKAAAQKGIESVKNNAQSAVVDLTEQ
jgi:uncharacterized protein YegP (UPF0339 family)